HVRHASGRCIERAAGDGAFRVEDARGTSSPVRLVATSADFLSARHVRFPPHGAPRARTLHPRVRSQRWSGRSWLGPRGETRSSDCLQRKESNMNWSQVEGNWKTLKAKARQKWGKLTNDDVEQIRGRRDELL